MKKNFTLIFSAFLLSCTAYAQDFRSIVGEHLTKSTSISEFEIVQNVYSDKIKAHQIHVQRTENGIPVFASYANYVVKDNRVVSTSKSENFDVQLGNLPVTAKLSFDEITSKLGSSEQLRVIKTSFSDLNTRAEGLYIFNEDVPQITYYIDENKQGYLAYSFSGKIAKGGKHEIYDFVVDAITGNVLEKHSQALTCGFHDHSFFNENKATFNAEEWNWLYDSSTNTTNPSYNVFKLPVESPNHGPRATYNQGALYPAGSPLGWHKLSETGETLPITRGNNTRTVHDNDSEGYETYNGADAATVGYVNGGENMNFDFPVDQTRIPYFYKEASTTNLFYMNNMMHDIYYRYGFTEQYGNFQANNFDHGASANDPVIALAQTGLSVGESNNATFSTPVDGRSPLMSMYLWSPPSTFTAKPIVVHSPSAVAGEYTGLVGNFGPGLPDPGITTDFVLLTKEETTGTPYDGCGNITNAAQVAGKIAVIARGDCTFVSKVQNAQDAGAVGAIIVNNVAGTISMGGESTTITIPSISVTNAVGGPIMTQLQNNQTVNGTLRYIEVPYIDGSFDNGIVAHEYGHGISTRQTGPRQSSACLNNLEQMGEGWSDFFGLMITQLPTDTATTRRGVGTFAVNQASTGTGIRPTAYSTNMSVNPATYANVANYGNSDSPHRTGYVWATMLWDLNWKMINKYGFTPDLINGNAGNTMTLDLVMEGLRLQPCRPGFVDGRNAILEADVLLNEGENQCDIWSVFARRGLGYSADQGQSSSRTDGTAAYDMPPAEVLNCSLKTVDTSIKDSFKIFPNPAKDVVHIYDETLKGKVTIEIVDMVGRVVSTNQVELKNNRHTIDTAALAKGVYVLKFTTNEGTITKKLIKN